ncbi:MAG TPA: hypothetical protein VFG58_08760 [Solirubrobacterales bacterium]|nr:hypothetical protein [Solirubrobacterales bacterium]
MNLDFFFTAVLGVTAIAGPRLIDDSIGTTDSLAVIATLLVGLQTLAAFLYLAVARINVAVGMHADRIKAIRDKMIPASRELVDLGPFAGAPKANKPWASTSGVATHVLGLALALFPFALAGALARSAGNQWAAPRRSHGPKVGLAGRLLNAAKGDAASRLRDAL